MSLTLCNSIGRGMFVNVATRQLSIVLYYKFNTEDVTGTRLLNYANNLYDASLVNVTIDTVYKVSGTGSANISITNNSYIYLNSLNTIGSTGNITFSFWIRPSNLKMHSSIFELGNGRGRDTTGMYMYGNSLATNVINGNLISSIMNFTPEITPFGTGTTAGTNTAGSTISTTVSNWVSISVTSDNSKMVIISNTNGYMYFSTYNKNTSTWSNFTRTNSGVLGNTYAVRITSDGSRGIISSLNNYIYYFTWNGSNYSALTRINDNTTRPFYGVGITANGERIVGCVNPGFIYYSDWNSSSGNYGALIQLNNLSANYISVDISPSGNIVAYIDSPGNIRYSVWNGSSYGNETTITSANRTRNLRFSHDGNILFNARPGSNIDYYYWNSNTNSFNITPSSVLNTSYDNWGFDVTADGTLYYGGLNNHIRSKKYFFINQSINLITNIDICNNTNAWSYITWSISNTGVNNYYLNGSLLTTVNGITPLLVPRIQNYIGTSDISYSFLNNYNGGIDEFAVYNTVLTQTQITNIYDTRTHPII